MTHWLRLLFYEFPITTEGRRRGFFSKYLVNFINEAVCCLGENAQFIYVNEATCRLLRYSRQELLSMRLKDLIEGYSSETIDLWQSEQQDALNCLLRTKDEQILSVTINIAYIQESEREFCCACIRETEKNTTSDTSDRGKISDFKPLQQKNLQTELTKTVSLLQKAFDSAAYGIIAVSFEGEVLSYNQKFSQMWQLPGSMILSKDSQDCQNFFANKLKNPESFRSSVWEISRESAEETFDILELKDSRTFLQESKPLLQGEKIIGRVWSIWDISEFRQQSSQIYGQLQENQPLISDESQKPVKIEQSLEEENQQLSELRARFFRQCVTSFALF